MIIERTPFFLTIALCFLIMGACMASSAVKEESIGLLPADREISGWVKAGSAIQCNSLAELAQQINGGAPFFIDRGAKLVIFQDYTRQGREALLTLEIYEMGNMAQAEKLFNDIYVEDPVSLSDISHNARLASKLIGVYVIDFIKNNFYLRVTINQKNSDTKKDLEQFAAIISDKIKE